MNKKCTGICFDWPERYEKPNQFKGVVIDGQYYIGVVWNRVLFSPSSWDDFCLLSALHFTMKSFVSQRLVYRATSPNNSSVHGWQYWVWERGQGGVSVWVECVCLCLFAENNGSWVHKTEEGFSSAGTVLTPLSQSELVAMCAVNLPLCVAEWERGTHSKVVRFEETLHLIKWEELGKVLRKTDD